MISFYTLPHSQGESVVISNKERPDPDSFEPKGYKVFFILLIISCIFLSIVYYGAFNIESIP